MPYYQAEAWCADEFIRYVSAVASSDIGRAVSEHNSFWHLSIDYLICMCDRLFASESQHDDVMLSGYINKFIFDVL